MIVLVSGKENADFPAIVEAARVLPKALALKCDRIRVETAGGARVAEFPIATVERFITSQGLTLQPDRIARQGRDWERHRPMWVGGLERGRS